jgi:hypothetical protein
MSLTLSLPAPSKSEAQTRRLRLRFGHRVCCQWTWKSHSGQAMSQNDEKKDGAVAAHGVEPRNLPPGGEGRIYGGHGQGSPCALCGAPIHSSQVEYEVEWISAEGPRRSHFHLACYEKLRCRRGD